MVNDTRGDSSRDYTSFATRRIAVWRLWDTTQQHVVVAVIAVMTVFLAGFICGATKVGVAMLGRVTAAEDLVEAMAPIPAPTGPSSVRKRAWAAFLAQRAKGRDVTMPSYVR